MLFLFKFVTNLKYITMDKPELKWNGEPTDEQFDKMEQFKFEFEAMFPDQTVELIGTRPKSRG